MSKSSKIVVHVPDDYIARSCEIVNRWLDKNEKYLNSFPPEHDEITKIEDFRFSRRNRQWNRPVLSSYLPTSSVRVRGDIVTYTRAQLGVPGPSTSSHACQQTSPATKQPQQAPTESPSLDTRKWKCSCIFF